MVLTDTISPPSSAPEQATIRGDSQKFDVREKREIYALLHAVVKEKTPVAGRSELQRRRDVLILGVDNIWYRIEPRDALDHDRVIGYLQLQGVYMLFVLPLYRSERHKQELHAKKIFVDPRGCHAAKLLYLATSRGVAHDIIWGPEWLPVPHLILDGALLRIYLFTPALNLERNPGLVVVEQEDQVRLAAEGGALRLRKSQRGVAHVDLGVRL